MIYDPNRWRVAARAHADYDGPVIANLAKNVAAAGTIRVAESCQIASNRAPHQGALLPAILHKTKHRGIVRVATNFLLNLIAYNLIRIPKLVAA
jgi:hypothetical protein